MRRAAGAQRAAQQPRRVEREVAQHAVGAGALEGQQRLHHHRVVVEPAVGGRGLEHRVLAADLVGEGRHAELVLHAAHDVQVGHAGLDHHHVGAFGEVERHLAQRLVAVARVHLVDLLVALAEVAGRADGVAERAVEGAGVLGAVGHDAGVDRGRAPSSASRIAPMRPSIMSLGATMSTPACGLHQRLLRQHRDRLVVEDVAAVVEQAVLAVAGERVERHVGQHAQLGEALLQLAHGARHQAVGVERLAAVGASSAPGRSPGTAPSPGCPARTHSSATGSRRSSCRRCTPGMRGRRPAPGRWPSSTNTGRIRSAGVQPVLAHQRAGERVAAQAARAAGGEGRQGCARRVQSAVRRRRPERADRR